MGKKRIRKTLTSKGDRRSTVAGVGLVRAAKSTLEKSLNKIAAWRDGKNPWITVPGPSKNQAMVRVRANTLYGDPRYAMANLFKSKGDE